MSSEEATGKRPADKPPGFRLPQIVTEAILRRGMKADVLTFKLRVLRLIELTFLVVVPERLTPGSKSPVYVRMWLDRSAEDRPGEIVVE